MDETLIQYLEASPVPPAPLLFILFTLSSLCCLPVAWINFACGALLGLGPGAVVANLAGITGAALTRFLARGPGGKHVDQWLRKVHKVQQIRDVLHDGGWRLAFFVRMSPLLPLGLSHWVFAFVDLKFSHYLLVTSLATFPAHLAWAQFGVTGRKSLRMWQDPSSASGAEWALLLTSICATLAFLVIFGILARRRLPSELSTHANPSSNRT